MKKEELIRKVNLWLEECINENDVVNVDIHTNPMNNKDREHFDLSVVVKE